jgi:DNA-binding NarL/FixJ family response regulator
MGFMEIAIPKKIFIVDDDEMSSTLLQDHLLSSAPHHITLFATGEDCLNSLAEKPDVVILDYYLNSKSKDAVNGMEILHTIKKHYPGIHVIMLSGQEHYGLAMQTIQQGADQYIIKDKDAFEQITSLISKMS